MTRLLLSVLAIAATAHASPHPDSLAHPIDTPGIIDTIIIAGNEKTRDYVILDEMHLKPGMSATPALIEFDRSRIYSLGLFTRVDIFSDSLEGKNFLFVDVAERWYIIPVPVFGFRDGDPKKPFYGAAVRHNNFQGRNQRLVAAVVFGYNPSLALGFNDPLIDRERQLYCSAALSYSRVRNRSERAATSGDFDEHHYDINGTLGRRFSLFETSGLNAGYQIVRIDDYEPGRTVSTDGTDRFLYATIDYTYDSRDLREYPSQGRLISGYVSKIGFGESHVNFARFGAEIRSYTPLPLDLTFAARMFGTIVSGGTVPTYSRAYFGYGERIRGYYRTVFEGENLFGTTIELRYPILPSRTIHMTSLPLLPEEFAVWRFGISLALFADAGVEWFRGDKLQFNSFHSGYGVGINFLLPYSYVARTAYARNEYGKGEFIIDLRATL